MKDERVLERSPLVLDQRARERYFEDGFLVVPGYVGAAWLARLRAVVAAKVEESRALAASDDQFDLAPDHSFDKPNIRRRRTQWIHPDRCVPLRPWSFHRVHRVEAVSFRDRRRK
jgi:hypothetical protein